MSIIEKVFKYEATELPVIKYEDEIWFKAVVVATILKYTNQRKAIRDHVDPEDKRKMSELMSKSKRNESFRLKKDPLKGNEGRYDYCMNHKYNNMLTFKIENETDLHVKVVSFLKKRYPHSLFTVTLGENQDTVHKRIDSFKKGYIRGSPDLIINNLHKNYTGFCIEFKSPKGNGVISPDQSMILLQYQNNGFKILVSNDYDQIIEQIIEYFRDVRIKCSYCPRRFISPQSLSNHIKIFHKM